MCPNSAQPRKRRPSTTAPPPHPVPSVSITIVWTSRPAPTFHLPTASDDPGQDLGAAEVDADDPFAVQTARLPYSLDGDGREALPRLPGRACEGQGPARAAADASGPKWARAAAAEDPQAAPALELEAPDRRDRARAPRARRRVGDR